MPETYCLIHSSRRFNENIEPKKSIKADKNATYMPIESETAGNPNVSFFKNKIPVSTIAYNPPRKAMMREVFRNNSVINIRHPKIGIRK